MCIEVGKVWINRQILNALVIHVGDHILGLFSTWFWCSDCCWCTWDYWKRWPLRPKSWSSIYYEVNSIFWICIWSTLDEKHFRDHKWVVNSIAKKKKKNQNIVNAMDLVKVSKQWLQVMRDDKWISLLTEVSSFCITHDISILNMNEIFVVSGRLQRNT